MNKAFPYYRFFLVLLLFCSVFISSCKKDTEGDPIKELTAFAGEDVTICPGASTVLGANPSAQGGDGNYIYSWSNNAASTANPMVSPSETTTYVLTVEDGRGTIATDEITVTVAEAFTANAGADRAVLAGTSVTLGGNPVGSGNGNYTYSWSDGSSAISTQENPEITPTATTTYEVTVSDENGCTASDRVIITISDFMVDAGSDTTICLGNSYILGGDPTASGNGTFTYSWDNGAGTDANPSVSPTQTTTYEVTVTDQNGVTQTDQITISIAESFTVDAGANQKIIAGETVDLTATVTGNGTYTYEWDNNAGNTAQVTVSPTQTTTYTIIVTDEYGCTESDEVTVELADFTVDAGTDETICPGSSTTLGGNPTADGPGSYSYSWSDGSTEISTVANPTVSPTSVTTYTVTVTDNADGFTITDEVTISVAESFTVDAGANQKIIAGETVDLTATVTGNGTYTYEWDNNAGNTAQVTVSPTQTTTYTIIVTDEYGCTESDEVTVELADFTVDAGTDETICPGSSTTLGGNPTADGPGSYSYSWSDGNAEISTVANPTVNPATTTTFTVTVTDNADGFSITDEIIIAVAESFTVDAGNDKSICAGEPAQLGGSPTADGNGSYSYSWSNGGTEIATSANPNVSPTSTTTYTLTVTDAFGCSKTDEITISVSPNFTVDAGNTQQICSGDVITLGGSPTANGSGTFTYEWSDGSSIISTIANPEVSPTSPTLYTVTVTNQDGCTKTSSVEIGVTTITSGSITFNYTGSEQVFTFPPCVTEVQVQIFGAQGEDGEDFQNDNKQGLGGEGAVVNGNIIYDAAKGNQLYLYVGGRDGYNGGGEGGSSANNDGGSGGGASDIRYGGSALANRIAVAGGGGGGAGSPTGVLANVLKGGDGGNSGQDGFASTGYPDPNQATPGGMAASQIAGGAGGAGGTNFNCGDGGAGTTGAIGFGGPGGIGGLDINNCPNQGSSGGGGGGGYHGGGGGGGAQGRNSAASYAAGGGGGGSSYIAGLNNALIAGSTNSGNGKIIISW